MREFARRFLAQQEKSRLASGSGSSSGIQS